MSEQQKTAQQKLDEFGNAMFQAGCGFLALSIMVPIIGLVLFILWALIAS